MAKRCHDVGIEIALVSGDGSVRIWAAAFRATGNTHMTEIGPHPAAPVGRILADAGLAVTAVLPDLDGRDRVVSVEI